MTSKFGICQQTIKQHPFWSAVIGAASLLGIVLLVVLVLGYKFNWGWTGLGPYTSPTKDSTFQHTEDSTSTNLNGTSSIGR